MDRILDVKLNTTDQSFSSKDKILNRIQKQIKINENNLSAEVKRINGSQRTLQLNNE